MIWVPEPSKSGLISITLNEDDTTTALYIRSGARFRTPSHSMMVSFRSLLSTFQSPSVSVTCAAAPMLLSHPEGLNEVDGERTDKIQEKTIFTTGASEIPCAFKRQAVLSGGLLSLSSILCHIVVPH